ncbi:MAG: hypothetical protein KF754_12145 [Planctomycetes bacterium]|nr:hypothetical protein [Planctomycetota bacterium]
MSHAFTTLVALVRPLVLPLLAGHCLLIATSCGNPRSNPDGPPSGNNPPANTQENPRPPERVLLQPAYRRDAKFRTTRTLRVEELTETERYLTESIEITLTRVLAVDERGRLMAIQRSFEQSLTRLTRGWGSPEEGPGELHGSTLELRRRQGGVVAEVIAGNASIGRTTFVLDGFESALLPIDPVAQGARWSLEGDQLSGLNRFIEALGFRIEKNSLKCALARVTADSAEVEIVWQVSGDLKGRTAVLDLSGSLVFDRGAKLVRELVITGGRRGGQNSQQIEIRVTRRHVDGWLDLDG